jgi:hypothetical protein
MKKLIIIPILAGAVAAAALWGPTAATARDCTVEGKCADISISGHTEPGTIRRGEKTTLKLTAKNNGPVESYGDWVQVTVPKELKVKSESISGDGKDYGCSNNGYGFVKCYTGDLTKEELSVVKIKVKAKKKGTFIIPAQAYADGSTSDPNGGNNQVSVTVLVQGGG